jgi:ATPase subunit of ABC transporter with duplicated ATPase domains
MNAKGQQKKGKVYILVFSYVKLLTTRSSTTLQIENSNSTPVSYDSQARERAYEELLQKASDYQKADKLESMFMPPGPRLGNVVVEAQGLQKGFSGRLLINNLSFNLPPGGTYSSFDPKLNPNPGRISFFEPNWNNHRVRSVL